MFRLGKTLLFLAVFLPGIVRAETTKKVFNPFTGTFDFITQLDSTTIASLLGGNSTNYVLNTTLLQQASFYVLTGTVTGAAYFGSSVTCSNVAVTTFTSVLSLSYANVSTVTITGGVLLDLTQDTVNVGTMTITSSGTVNGAFSVLAGTSTTQAKVGGCVFDHYIDSGSLTTAETDLYTDTLPSNLFSANGHKVLATYAGTFVNSGTATRELRMYFGGTNIFDSGALSVSAASEWTLNVLIVRDTSSSVRCSVWANLTGAAASAFDNYATVTGLTFSNTQVLKISGQAGGIGAATNDIVAKMAYGEWKSAF